MVPVPGYHFKEKLYESYNSYVYRAQHEETRKPVIIKILKGEYPDNDRIIRLRREYEILKGIELEGVVSTYGFETCNNSCALIMEDFGAESLKKILEIRKLNLIEFLELSIGVCKILGQLHQLNIIHKNINPSNIVWNQESGQIKIIDFGVSSVLSREVAAIHNPKVFEGTINYISPEQTGRMNRILDYRTDLYSLGVTFYELLFGQLPFPFSDPMDIVHCHIAKDPLPPAYLKSLTNNQERQNLEILSKMILKLMAKSADERYQSAFGLMADLENCYRQLKDSGRIKAFKTGIKDFSYRFQIPQKLYGREKEIEILLDSFDRVCQGNKEMTMVSGYAGIGKSALVNEIHRSVVARKGYFISGKFEKFKRNIPYYSIIQAFQQLIRQILTESEEQINIWKLKIMEAVGPNGQVISDVIPEVELIIGKQPPVPEITALEAQNRFNHYFSNFIRTFASAGHPLTIFLDDFHWIDMPSLNLVNLIMSDSEAKYLYLIGAYRDNEIDKSHPVLNTVNKIEKAGTRVNSFTLSSLDFSNVNQLIADTLKCSGEKTEDLANLCLKKTNGNPFFLIQFLYTIYKNHLFEFDNWQMIWHWEISKIEKLKVTDNVVDLMVHRIQRLSEKTQDILKLAACIGNQFDLNTLSIVSEKSMPDTAYELWEALQEEIILPLGDVYKYINSDSRNSNVNYRFAHDRIHNAAYSLIEENDKKELHLKIGRLLLSNALDIDLEEEVFNITNQLNSGMELIADKNEKSELAKLNYLSGKKAMASTAYEIAYRYYSQGIELIGKNGWYDSYTLALSLYTEAAEASYLTGNFEEMDDLSDEILKNSRTLLDKIRINEIIIQSLLARARIRDAVETAIEILKQLGVHIKKKPRKYTVLLSMLKLRILLFRRTPRDLRDLPLMRDDHMLAAMRILMNAASSAYYGNTLLAIYMGLKMVYLSVRYGNSVLSPYGYVVYGAILHSVEGRFDLGYKYGLFSIELLNKLNAREYQARIYYLFNLFTKHWKDKLSTTIEPLTESYQRGLETGDYEYVSYCSAYAAIHSLHSGLKLDLAETELTKSFEFARKVNQRIILHIIGLNNQLALNFMGASENRTELVGDYFNEHEMYPWLIEENVISNLGTLFTLKGMICYFFGSYEEAFKNAVEANKYKRYLIGLVYLPLLYFYTSLIFLESICRSGFYKREYLMTRVRFNQRTLRIWARNAPDNHLHKWHLVEAEKYRVEGRHKRAIDHYDKAILYARKNGFIHEEALANELAGKYYLHRENEVTAKSYITEARYLYIKWGAKAKVRHLDEEYPLLLSISSIHGVSGEEQKRSRAVDLLETNGESIDLAAVLKASQILSGEIHLQKLLEKLLKIVVTNAGAEKGYILLKEDEKFFIEAGAVTEKEKIKVLHHIPVTESKDIAQVVINYVDRTKETINLNDASDEDLFKYDDYIICNQPKSLFCMPLISQNRLSGILYLENNLITGAFTSGRVEMLEMLCGQIVISIENARLYKNLEEYNRNLEEKVEKRTAEISLKNEQLNFQKEELHKALDDLKHSNVQLIQSEKMASLGQLIAGIAHEINNPVTFISAGVDSLVTNLDEVGQVLKIYQSITPESVESKLVEIEKLKDKLEFREAMTEIGKLIESIKNGTRRTTEIVKGLRTFSRLDEDSIKISDIHDGLDSTLILLRNKYKNRIDIVKHYGDIPAVECYPGQLSQVFMNILSNAVDSIDEKGTITIRTMLSDEYVRISIRDTGKGIPDDIVMKIFDPFYTTKDVGKGTGLGLSISQRIIEQHKGTISVKSEPGTGSEFIIQLPVKQLKG
ncbi:MAG: AAA family ATPase [Bacteroidales bacterium]|nr:AAA family ATPase [Bacteroidales bacterium]